MQTATVACPGCSGAMPLTAWAPGRQLRCPRCKATFRLGTRPGDAELVLTQGTVAASPAPPRPVAPVPIPAVPIPAVPVPAIPIAVATPTPVMATRAPVVPAPLPAPTPTPPPGGAKSRVPLILGVVAGLIFFIGGTIGLALLVAQQKPTTGKPTENTPITQNTNTGSGQNPPISAPIGTAPGINPQPGNNPPLVNNPPMQPPAPVRRLPPELQTKVDEAIEKGVAYLQKYVREDGSINGNVVGYPNGALFLLGLTLLECGVSAKEPRMAALTERVRAYAKSRGTKTYEISLALLYLDRLGDASDKPLIQTLGLQLLAGQQLGGGWTYDCQRLSSESERQLYLFLEQTRPEKASELMLRDSGGRVLELGGKLVPEESLEGRSIKGLEVAYNKLMGIQDELRKFPELQRVPSLRAEDPNQPVPPQVGRGRAPRLAGHGPGDNSNTQFAALGMWVANRHGIPCERTLALLSARFRTSQAGSGGWGYVPGSGETPAMTCAGLLALAIGHGVRVEDANEKREDEQIQKGLKSLSKHVGTPSNLGLYFLWSVERVGVLFNLEKIGDTDWYRWGVEKLLPAQHADGSWMMGGYHGSHQLTDTCFALLFLRKTNFVRDLSNKLEQVLDIKGSLRQGNP